MKYRDIPSDKIKIVTENDQYVFHCLFENCNQTFKKSCNFRDHLRIHTGLRPYECEYCNKTFTQNGNLKKHLINIHNHLPIL